MQVLFLPVSIRVHPWLVLFVLLSGEGPFTLLFWAVSQRQLPFGDFVDIGRWQEEKMKALSRFAWRFRASLLGVSGGNIARHRQGDSRRRRFQDRRRRTPDAPELTVKDGVPKGTLHEFTMNSEDSKIYPGLKGPYKRKVAVYVPKQYVAGTAAPFIVVQDGIGVQGHLPKILDNMIHEQRLPAMIAIFINSGGGDGKGSERGLEYDTVSENIRGLHRDRGAAPDRKGLQGDVHQGPRGPGDDGRQFGRGLRVHDGLVPARPVPSRAELLRNLRRSAIAEESRIRRTAPGNTTKTSFPKAIPSRCAFGCKSARRTTAHQGRSVLAQLGAGQRPHGGRLEGQGLSLPLRVLGEAGHVAREVVNQTLPEALLWLWQGYPVMEKGKGTR